MEEWRSQIKRGTLTYCLLLMISTRERYGYEIMSELEKYPVLSSKESTIYPLLRRLQKEGYLTSFWQETAEGVPPRKYYALEQKGREYMESMNREWEELTRSVEELKGSVKENG